MTTLVFVRDQHTLQHAWRTHGTPTHARTNTYKGMKGSESPSLKSTLFFGVATAAFYF